MGAAGLTLRGAVPTFLPMQLLIALALLVAFVLGVRYLQGRADVVILIEGGAATLARGEVPPTVLHDLDEIARKAPQASGEVRINGRGEGLELATEGLDEGLAQRVRNTLLIHRGRL